MPSVTNNPENAHAIMPSAMTQTQSFPTIAQAEVWLRLTL